MIVYCIIFAVLIVLEILYWLYPEATDRIKIPSPISYAVSAIMALIEFALAVYMFYMIGEDPEHENVYLIIGIVILLFMVISFIHSVKKIKNEPQRQLTNAIYWNDFDRAGKLVRKEMKREEQELQGNKHILGKIGATLFFFSLFLIIILLMLVYLA